MKLDVKAKSPTKPKTVKEDIKAKTPVKAKTTIEESAKDMSLNQKGKTTDTKAIPKEEK